MMNKAELSIVRDLKRLRQLAQHVGLVESTKWVDGALSRMASHHFSIAVIGEFKRGKSTFINALLGEKVLPSGVTPCSAALTRVTYGHKPSVRLIFRAQEGEPEEQKEIRFDDLAAYVTKLTPEAEAIAATIKEAIVSYPAAYCRKQVDIIDTPGLNDDETMTEVTLGILPHVSAVIFVIMPEAPFAHSEGDFLHNQLLLQDINRVIFVVNAIDRLKSESERERVLAGIKTRIKNSVEERLQQKFGKESEEYKRYRQRLGEPLVFGLSSYNALQAKLNHNRTLLAESGFPVFEAALERFLMQILPPAELKLIARSIRQACQQLKSHLDQQATLVLKWQEQLETTYGYAGTHFDTLQQLQQLQQLYQSGKALDEMWTEVDKIYDKSSWLFIR